jgi:hypothetical protein
MGDLPSTYFPVHLTTCSLPNHSGDIQVNWIIPTTIWEAKAWPGSEKVQAGLSKPVQGVQIWKEVVVLVQGVHLWKEVVVLGGALILVMPISGLHLESDQLEDEATP